MITAFNYIGKWKLPTSDETIDGTLSFNPEKGAKLDLHGKLSDGWAMIDVIIGETIVGEITLIDCFPRAVSRHMKNITISTYEPTYIVEGCHFLKKRDVCFLGVKFNALNLYQWLDTTGCKSERKTHSNDYSFTFNKPQNINFEINDSLHGTISYECLVKNNYNDKIEIQELCFVNFVYNAELHFLKILDDISYFLGFISLVTYEQSYPISIVLIPKENKGHSKPIKLYYSNNLYHHNQRFIQNFDQLVVFADISHIFNNVLKNWYEKYTELNPVFNLLIYTIRHQNKFDIENFMDITRALETFHRRTQNLTTWSNDKYEKLVNTIIDNPKLNNDELKWIKEKLEYGNEPSLRKRLKDLISKYSNSLIEEKIRSDKNFCQVVVHSRNYYTHFDALKEKMALKNKDLYILNQKLMIILISCIFNHIGIDNSHFEEGLKCKFNKYFIH